MKLPNALYMVIANKSNLITHWDYYTPSNRDDPITNYFIQSNCYYQLPTTNYLFIKQTFRHHNYIQGL
jgi:hypothetical protein